MKVKWKDTHSFVQLQLQLQLQLAVLHWMPIYRRSSLVLSERKLTENLFWVLNEVTLARSSHHFSFSFSFSLFLFLFKADRQAWLYIHYIMYTIYIYCICIWEYVKCCLNWVQFGFASLGIATERAFTIHIHIHVYICSLCDCVSQQLWQTASVKCCIISSHLCAIYVPSPPAAPAVPAAAAALLSSSASLWWSSLASVGDKQQRSHAMPLPLPLPFAWPTLMCELSRGTSAVRSHTEMIKQVRS